MKPIVVSAACAEPAPKAVPRVSAALPCKRCRREILPKSMGCSSGGWTAANSRLRRSGGAPKLRRNLHARAFPMSIVGQYFEIYDLFTLVGFGRNLCRHREAQNLSDIFGLYARELSNS